MSLLLLLPGNGGISVVDTISSVGVGRLGGISFLDSVTSTGSGNVVTPPPVYDTKTRLLLNCAGGPGVDSSEFARANTVNGYVSSQASSPFGAAGNDSIRFLGDTDASQVGELVIGSPGTMFANVSGSTKLISMWFKTDSVAYSAQGLFHFYATDWSLRASTESDGRITVIGDAGGLFIAQTNASAANHYSTGWHHLYIYINGTNLRIGLDGQEVKNYTHTSNIFGSAASHFAMFGNMMSYWALRGNLDAVEILENSTKWTGGAYTLPVQPTGYGTAPASGGGENAVDYVGSQGTGEVTAVVVPGVGANTVDSVTQTGAANVFWPARIGTGANTVDSVVSETPPLHNPKTRLLVKFNDHGALGYSSTLGLNYSLDTAAAGRKVYLETPSGLEHTSTQGMFGTPSMRFGNPSGTHNPGRMFVEPTTGLFSDSATAARRFDLWFRKEADAIYGLCALFSITFLNGDHVYLWRSANDIGINIKKAGVETSITGSYPSGTNNIWRHVRVLLNDNTVVVSAGGTQRATQTLASAAWPGGPSNPIAEVIFGQFPPLANADPLYYGFRGCLDGIEWLEGDTSYTGGSYTLPTREPADFDPTYIAGISGVGENTTATISSSGDGKIVLLASGSNSVSDFQGSGRVEFGQWWVGVGANTLDYVQSSWTVFQVPPAIGTGSATTGTSSSGDGLVQWLIRASGSNTVENVAHGGTGEVISPPERTGQGQNTTTVSSLATGSVSVLGSGASSTEVTAIAAGLVAFNAVSHVLVEVFSSGSGKAIVSAAGWNSTSVSGSGFTTVETLGRGTSEIGVAAVCNGSVLCAGSGGNALDDVRTYFPAGYFDAFIYEVVKQQRNEHWVKQ